MATTAKRTTRKTTQSSTRKPAAPKGRKPAPIHPTDDEMREVIPPPTGVDVPPVPTPEPTTPSQARCLVPGCPRYEVRRGLCHPCAAEAGELIRKGFLPSWEALEAEGKARPLGQDRAKGDLPHRKSWFLGHWTPEGGYLVIEGEPAPTAMPAPEEVPA